LVVMGLSRRDEGLGRLSDVPAKTRLVDSARTDAQLIVLLDPRNR
jgi:hypothetical protein